MTPAWLAGDEHRRGTLSPGTLADLVVLDRDPVTCPADELAHLEVDATLMGGRITHVHPDSPLASVWFTRPPGTRPWRRR